MAQGRTRPSDTEVRTERNSPKHRAPLRAIPPSAGPDRLDSSVASFTSDAKRDSSLTPDLRPSTRPPSFPYRLRRARLATR